MTGRYFFLPFLFLCQAVAAPNSGLETGRPDPGVVSGPCPDGQPPAGFVYVPPGTFLMGDGFDEGSPDEKPLHRVTLSGFYLGATELTFEAFDAFCTASGHPLPADEGWGRGQRPVINVDWYDAVEYCNWRSRQDGLSPVYRIDKTTPDPANHNAEDTKRWTVGADWTANGYRLPTEAEWEFAARATLVPAGRGRNAAAGGGRVRFGDGQDRADPAQMNFDARKDFRQDYSVAGAFRGQTLPVGSLGAPNALGLHDLAGNVWEWCHDWYDEGYYSRRARSTNPRGPESGQYRCVRGGCWGFNPVDCRAANRNSWYPYKGYRYFGFRLLRH